MRLLLICACVVAAAPVAGVAAEPAAVKVDFNRDVRPILSNNCFACHGPDEKTRKGKLRLDTREGAVEASVVRLTPREVEVLTRWIKEGANYSPHWAYVKPVRPAVPKVGAPNFVVRNPVDAFLASRLIAEKLPQQPEADRYALARRAALDLTGLPPTPEEVEAFVKDASPTAYESFVDKLLTKPAYGEHMARGWLDLARYADSAGYADDPPRTIWKYRDYVITSFNANKPFDVFTVEQIAGDLLPKPTTEQLVATAFHRNTMTNSEGGTNDEEFRNVAVVDRVNTTYMVWMGTSMACAQCHTHKYDPLTQKEFFASYAFFNNTADADHKDESPTLPFWDGDQQKKKDALQAQVAELEAKLKGKKPEEMRPEREKLAALKKEDAALKPATSVPVMKELVGAQRRKTRLQYRGNFLDLGDEVTEAVPAALHQFPADAPRTRLEFAKWLVSPENPLTARVTANRLWEQVFGTGIVRTSEEFGAQGELPSHPELLDWLAVELQTDWDVKRFLKLLVTSAAYRQSSKVSPGLFERDPDNRLLARGPRVRLSAEMVRDQALAAAGLLSPKVLGPSVKPPQPNLGVSAAFGGSIDWQTSAGEDKFRRGIYTQWRRSNPYPSMSTFDAPNRDTCTVRRARTNTPLQALVTMNDPVYVEASQGLARRMMEKGGTGTHEKAAFGFRACLVRPPTPAEVERLVKLFREAQTKFTADPAKAKQFATNPLGPLPKGVDPIDAAAWTVVANVLLNLDEMLLKR
jgi:hypothetical protein